MLTCKDGVVWKWLRPEIYRLFEGLEAIFARHKIDCVITSAIDGKHSTGSLHYSGYAIDIRSKSLPSAAKKQAVLKEIQALCGPGYDVLLEHLGGENEHFHLEWDPKPSVERRVL